LETQVIIVGAGITGIRVAQVLQSAGIDYLLLDAETVPGGRIKTNFTNGYTLDHGFQIINTAYPEFDNCGINLQELNLKPYASGAKLFFNGKPNTLADPFREKNALFSSLFSPHAGIKDLWLTYKLRRRLSNTALQSLFDQNTQITADFLKDFGFSQTFIQRFFKPFYSGIFLERELQTPAAMFAFVFSMFDRGYAALPQGGMCALPAMMCSKLPAEKVLLGHKVLQIETGAVVTDSHLRINAPFILLATGTSVMNETGRSNWNGNHSASVLYYGIDTDLGLGRYIGLNAGGDGKVNLISIPSNVQASYAPEGKKLLSVSLWPGLTATEQNAHAMLKEVEKMVGQSINGEFLGCFNIPAALPKLDMLQYEPQIGHPAEGIWCGGDFSAYPSLNAALRAGTLLAERVLQS